jgi:predicted Fe-Mo cluster-binding NifX family protein
MGKSIESDVADIFARCPYFIIAEIENEKIQKVETIENESNLSGDCPFLSTPFV